MIKEKEDNAVVFVVAMLSFSLFFLRLLPAAILPLVLLVLQLFSHRLLLVCLSLCRV